MRVGGWLFGLSLLLLPQWLRERVGAEMREAFDARQLEAVDGRVPAALVGVWLLELTGVVATAVRARRGDAWARRVDRVLGAARQSELTRRFGGRRGGRWMDTVVGDVRFAVRAAMRRPGAYALALVTCALGIGATTGMFSVVDTVLWRPLPYPDADRVVSVYLTSQSPGHATGRSRWSYPEYVDWRGPLQRVFEASAIYAATNATLTGDEPQSVPAGMASPELFSLLGASPVLGRGFSASNDWEAERNTVVLSNAFWKSRFGGDPDVIGRDMPMGDGRHTIIGVLPAGFSLADVKADVWLMRGGPSEEGNRDNHGWSMVARLKPGVSQVRAELEAGNLLGALSADDAHQHRASVVQRREDITRDVRTPLKILLFAALLLLAVSCVTVASIVLGIGIDREHELAVRSAIGAGRGRVVRQLVTESVALAAASGVVGVVIAFVVTRALVLLAPPDLPQFGGVVTPSIPRLDDVSVSARVLVFATLTSMLVGTAFGLVPALSLTRRRLVERLRRQRATTRRRLHSTLVVVQLALACVLLTGAGLLARTILKLDRVDPGFDATGVLTLRVDVPWRELFHIEEWDGARYDQVFDRLRDAIATVPGVEAVGLTRILPFAGDYFVNSIEPEGYARQEGEPSPRGQRIYVSPNYLDVMRLRLLEGRRFTDADDRPDVPKVTIVTENLARRFWPGESAVGHTITFFAGTATIVGVVADIRDHTLISGQDYYRYLMPRHQSRGEGGSFVIRAEPSIDPASLAPAVRRRVGSTEPGVSIRSMATLRQRLRDSVAEQRYRARLVWVFAALSGAFAILGVYGVTSRSVAARTREIGIRMVLGERRNGIVRLVLREGLRLALAGSVIGLSGGLAASRMLASYLFDTETTDPVTLVSVTLGLALLSLAASLGPSRRAASVDPMVAIRSD